MTARVYTHSDQESPTTTTTMAVSVNSSWLILTDPVLGLQQLSVVLRCHPREQCHSIVPAGGATMITTFDAGLPKMPTGKIKAEKLKLITFQRNDLISRLENFSGVLVGAGKYYAK